MAKKKRTHSPLKKHRTRLQKIILQPNEVKRTVKALQAAIDAGYLAGRGGGHRSYISIAANALGITHRALTHRMDVIGRHYPKTKIPEPHPFVPKEIHIEQMVTETRAKRSEGEARTKLKGAYEEITALQDRLRDLEWAASNADARPAEWTLPHRRRNPSEHMPYLLTSDHQVGEVIRREETDNAHGYNSRIYRTRYRRLISATIDLCANQTGSAWKFPGIIYARGGDTISGAIHDELAMTDDLTPIEAVETAFEEESAGIHKLLEAFGRVDVKDVGGGNHDRTTHKPQSKRANARSYDRLVSFMLRLEFKRDPRVHFQATESPDVFFPIYDQNILLTHGDKIGSRGGQGMIGPAATIMRGAQKIMMEQQALGRRVDRVDMGHFHTPMWYDWVVCNGCLPGYSEYAKLNRLRPGPPSQFLIFHHPKYGAVDFKNILLEPLLGKSTVAALSR